MPRTRTEAALEEAERQHADDPERVELLARARRFKASWLELAEGLSSVRKSGSWQGWGYGSFEDYAKRELHLRPETVDKLTGSFAFLQRRAPEVLKRDGVGAPIPSYQAVDFLRRAEEQESAPEEAVTELRKRVIEESAPLPALSRKFRDIIFPVAQEDRRERDIGSLRAAAKRLKEQVGATEAVPRRLAGRVNEALDELLVALGDDS